MLKELREIIGVCEKRGASDSHEGADRAELPDGRGSGQGVRDRRVKRSGFSEDGNRLVPGDANIERIRRIKKNLAGTGMKVKAAGGIRTREEFDELLEMGAERFGINTQSAIEIVKSFE